MEVEKKNNLIQLKKIKNKCPKAVKIEYEVIPKSKLDTKMMRIVAVSMFNLYCL